MVRRATNPLLVFLVLFVLSCLLVYPPSPPPPHHPYSVSMPRSLRLGSQQQHPTALKLTCSQEMAIVAATNLGKPAVRMDDFEVDDYPPPDHNHHHGPGHGRA